MPTFESLEALRDGAEDLIATYLTERGWDFSRTEEGVFAISFQTGREENPLHLLFAAGGDAGPGLAVVARAEEVVARPQFGWALWGINTWNATSRVVKARLAVEDWMASDSGAVVLDAWMPLVGEVPSASVEGFLDLVVVGILTFWGEGQDLEQPSQTG